MIILLLLFICLFDVFVCYQLKGLHIFLYDSDDESMPTAGRVPRSTAQSQSLRYQLVSPEITTIDRNRCAKSYAWPCFEVQQ